MNITILASTHGFSNIIGDWKCGYSPHFQSKVIFKNPHANQKLVFLVNWVRIFCKFFFDAMKPRTCASLYHDDKSEWCRACRQKKTCKQVCTIVDILFHTSFGLWSIGVKDAKLP